MTRTVRITQIDGKLPNLALMRISAWHRELGDDVRWERGTSRRFDEPDYDIVYGSAVFSTSAKAVALFKKQFPDAIVGGSGGDENLRVEEIVPSQFKALDYSAYPNFNASLGYASRGCRFNCDHCGVPRWEGKPRAASQISQIWRGEPYPKHLHLLDNDFFGAPDWRERKREIVEGGFKVCFNQGVTARVMTAEQAEAIVEMHPWDDQFKRARLYVAWDDYDQERVWLRGIDRLEAAGWKPEWTFCYMLIGFDPEETWERIFYRFNRMVERGVRPYPMVFAGDANRPRPKDYDKLKRFQRWVIAGAHRVCKFEEYSTRRNRDSSAPLFEDEIA